MGKIFSANLPCRRILHVKNCSEWSQNDCWNITHIEQMAHLTAMAYCSNLYLSYENQLYKRRGVLCTVLNHKMSHTAVEFETGFLKIHDFQAYVNATSIFLDIFFVVCCLEMNLLASAKR
jgi:hypothetical protein